MEPSRNENKTGVGLEVVGLVLREKYGGVELEFGLFKENYRRY